MPGHRTRWATTALLTTTALAAALTVTACSDDDTPSSVSSSAGKAASAFESATAEAGRRLDEIKGGIDARDAVKLGGPKSDSDGRTTVEVTADNTTDSTKSFAVQIDFSDEDGNRLDRVVVTVSDVPAAQTGKATARSNRKLSGEVKAEVEVEVEVERAVRY